MSVTYSDRASQGSAILQQATRQLEEILGRSAGLVKAEWDRREDARGRVLYTLRLSDWTGGVVSADFTPDELQSSSQVRYRLHRLWGDLLQERSQKQLEQLTGATGEVGE